MGNLDAQVGQLIAAGEHIGQIITPELKVQAQIDEHYVERVVTGLAAALHTRRGKLPARSEQALPGGQRRTVSHRLAVYRRQTREHPCRTDLSHQPATGRPGTGNTWCRVEVSFK